MYHLNRTGIKCLESSHLGGCKIDLWNLAVPILCPAPVLQIKYMHERSFGGSVVMIIHVFLFFSQLFESFCYFCHWNNDPLAKRRRISYLRRRRDENSGLSQFLALKYFKLTISRLLSAPQEPQYSSEPIYDVIINSDEILRR